MATTDEIKNQIARVEPQRDLRALIEKSAKELGRALPELLGS